MSTLLKHLNNTTISSFLLFSITLALLLIACYGGKYLFQRRQGKDNLGDTETSIVLGAILSLLALMIGFVLSISIQGFDERQKTEQNEAIAIGSAYQYSKLLDAENQIQVRQLLDQYLAVRIDFFLADPNESITDIKRHSLALQSQVWDIIIGLNKQPSKIDLSLVMSAYNELYSSQQKTYASWKVKIPNAAWLLLITFAFSTNMLIGYNIRGMKGHNWLILILPILTTLALFIIADIDTPGEGIINFTPDNLLSIKQSLA
ncbi:hypothetical protein RHO12_07715 [Orbus sturtevantii]|uniref:bestrophin-like domain n=1 Tax=Orbus sturtevantii TaxID=3074109 RepID=UPI00370DB37C